MIFQHQKPKCLEKYYSLPPQNMIVHPEYFSVQPQDFLSFAWSMIASLSIIYL